MQRKGIVSFDLASVARLLNLPTGSVIIDARVNHFGTGGLDLVVEHHTFLTVDPGDVPRSYRFESSWRVD